MTPYRIIRAAELTPGPATVIVRLPGRALRSRVELAAVQPHGVVKVAFACGEVLTLSARVLVGVIDPAVRRRARRPSRRRGEG
ncbi:MAG: hypothetical protein R3F16_25490 [Myxococcota bacterium]